MTDWTNRLTQKERIEATVELLDGPTHIKDIANQADVPTDDAKTILKDISGDRGIARQTDDNHYDVDLDELRRRI